MIDRLRMWLNRPLVDGSRRALFVAAATVILSAATALAIVNRDPDGAQPAGTTTTSSPQPPPAADPQPPPVSRERPSEEGHATGLVGTKAEIAAAKRATRRFLDGYLEYAYGRRDASSIAAASPALLRRLAAQAPRVPASIRKLHPQVVHLQPNGAGHYKAGMLAVVEDGGPGGYNVLLELERRSSGWQVIAVGG